MVVRMGKKRLGTAAAVLDALGGNAHAARLLGQTPQTVGMWRDRERIPANQYANVSALLETLDMCATNAVFGMKELA